MTATVLNKGGQTWFPEQLDVQEYIPNQKDSADPENDRGEFPNFRISPLEDGTLAKCRESITTEGATYRKLWQLGLEIVRVQTATFAVQHAVHALQVHEISQYGNHFMLLLGVFRWTIVDERGWGRSGRSVDPSWVSQCVAFRTDHFLAPHKVSSGGDEGMGVCAGHGHEIEGLEEIKRGHVPLHLQDHFEEDL